MPKYQVRGASKDTGKDVVTDIVASSEKEAESIANEEGIFVSRISAYDDGPKAAVALQASPAVAYQQTPTKIVVAPDVVRGVSGFGVAALVLGILCLIVAWIPLLGLVAVPLAAIGFLLALLGTIVSLVGGRSGVGMPVAGMVVCGLALILSLLSTAGAVGVVGKSVELARANAAGASSRRANSVPVSAALPSESSLSPAARAFLEKLPVGDVNEIREAMLDPAFNLAEVPTQTLCAIIGFIRMDKPDARVADLMPEKVKEYNFWRALADRALASGADVNAALAEASRLHDLQYLFDHGANIHRAVDSDGTPLLVTMLNAEGRYDKLYEPEIRFLLQRGANVNLADRGGNTPLHVAAKHNAVWAIPLLMSAGADPNIKNGEGRTPLDVANISMQTEFAEALKRARPAGGR